MTNNQQLHELALFAGDGGGILGSEILGWRTMCAVERNAYAASVLAQRQNDGTIKPFPIWSDVESFDGRRWRGHIDIVSGGFPCQDISQAGRGAGIDGDKSWVWSHMARITDEVRPTFVWVENSQFLTRRGGARVLGDLASMGYDAVWGVVGAAHAGAPQVRKRMWILAYADCAWEPQQTEARNEERNWSGHLRQDAPNSDEVFRHGWRIPEQVGRIWGQKKTQGDGYERGVLWPPESGVGRVADGVANRLDRINGLGNGQVPGVVAMAWKILQSIAQ